MLAELPLLCNHNLLHLFVHSGITRIHILISDFSTKKREAVASALPPFSPIPIRFLHIDEWDICVNFPFNFCK